MSQTRRAALAALASLAAPAQQPEQIVMLVYPGMTALDLIGPPVLSPQFDYESYYGGLALTVRTYLAARFGFNAHALTTRELERRMVSHGVDRWQARLVGGLLERCDDAVYVRRYPEVASADHDLTVAYEIVELSRPRLESIEGQAALA